MVSFMPIRTGGECAGRIAGKPARGQAGAAARPFPIIAGLVVAGVILACCAWASAAYTVTDPSAFRYFPPFKAGRNENASDHLGGEYFCIASAIASGQGYSNPFHQPTGPTAWMPPVLPTLFAGLLWISSGNKDFVTAAAVLFQVSALILTGFLVVGLANRYGRKVGAVFAACVYLGAVLWDFHDWFQFTHDHALILLVVNAILAVLLWRDPTATRRAALTWGIVGGGCALVSPIVGILWAALTVPSALLRRRFAASAVAVVAACVVVTPWTVRNLIAFGRLIPIKSNAAYELYQSQCLQDDGLVHGRTFRTHPYATDGPERREYASMGETRFLDHKMDLFRKSVAADPVDFCDRVASRLLGVTLWYMPGNRKHLLERPWQVWFNRVLHPLPFVGLLVLAFAAPFRRLNQVELACVVIYGLYFLPYVLISYYNRYALPMLGVKTLLIVFGTDRLLSVLRRGFGLGEENGGEDAQEHTQMGGRGN
jgi:hypothetical protein